MPYKRTRSGLSFRTAPGRRTRRTFNKRVSRKRMMRSSRGRTLPNYSFHRWITALPSSNVNVTNCTYDTGSSIIQSAATVATSSISFIFSLADIPNPSEFSNLFDAYMITGVMLQIKMINNPTSNFEPFSSTQTGANFYPTIWYTPDHDDHATVTLPQIKEFERVRHKVLHPNRELNIMLRPTTLTQLYRSTTTTGYSQNRRRQWIDMAQTDVPHYGIKMVFDFEGLTSNAGAEYNFKVNAKYYFKTKQVR